VLAQERDRALAIGIRRANRRLRAHLTWMLVVARTPVKPGR
jgi:hypothetical protein